MRHQSSSLAADAIRVEGVARRFAGRWALRGASMRARPGEVLAIRGSNGSGKSTLLRIVASALRPTRGACFVFEHDVVREAAAVRRLVGLLGHSPALYQDLTVAENLRFAARMMGLASDGRAIDSVIARVGLGDAAQERARSLSSGMQRRVALARLMLRPPALLLLDEPYNSFDSEGVALVDRLVLATRDAGGVTMLVTHDVERVEGIADRVLTMEEGRLRDDGSSLETSAVESGEVPELLEAAR